MWVQSPVSATRRGSPLLQLLTLGLPQFTKNLVEPLYPPVRTSHLHPAAAITTMLMPCLSFDIRAVGCSITTAFDVSKKHYDFVHYPAFSCR